MSGSITDVPGLRVGHAQRIGDGWLTGTTVVLPPTAGAVITAGFEFDVPVRFDTDRISTSVEGLMAGEIPSVPVVELRV